jgi:hypothetical protein
MTEPVPDLFLATCLDCTPRLSQSFYGPDGKDRRDAWANAHRAGTGHQVTDADPGSSARRMAGLLLDPITAAQLAHVRESLALPPGRERVAWSDVAFLLRCIDRLSGAAELERIAREILASYRKTDSGYAGRVGQMQIAKWTRAIDEAST